jgi:hypothetical protein
MEESDSSRARSLAVPPELRKAWAQDNLLSTPSSLQVGLSKAGSESPPWLQLLSLQRILNALEKI